MRTRTAILVCGLLVGSLLASTLAEAAGDSLRVFTARKILTLEASAPEATAVAVDGAGIVAVGTLDSLRQTLGDRPYEVDRRFADYVLLPGFIDNHLHPSMAAVLLPMEFATPYDWDLPGRKVVGVRGREAYLARLRELEAGLADPKAWLIAWGYHALFHGPLSQADLDAVSSTRPVIAWHRSFHELYANRAALAAMGITAEQAAAHPQVDFANGHFFETGLELAVGALAPLLLAPERFAKGLTLTRDTIHQGGITTVADMAAGLFDLDAEWPALKAVLEQDTTPFRVILVADGRRLSQRLGSKAALARIDTYPERNTPRLRFVRQVKLFADGAFYSQLMQMGPPGYLDGHHGEWLMEPAELEEAARTFWNAGYQIHVHVNGDLGVKAALDVLQKLQTETPRSDHRFAMHHYGSSTEAQAERTAKLGAIVSANPFYLYALGDAYSEVGLGPERASHMVRLGSLVRAGVPVSLHSDFTMAPAAPLALASVAVNRRTANGTLMAPEERISVQQALRAITIDAAHAIGMEDEIGSIAPGKRADFTVLAEDPTAVPPGRLGEIEIWGTVFEGTPRPIREP